MAFVPTQTSEAVQGECHAHPASSALSDSAGQSEEPVGMIQSPSAHYCEQASASTHSLVLGLNRLPSIDFTKEMGEWDTATNRRFSSIKGHVIATRYRVVSLLGYGAHGMVVKADDERQGVGVTCAAKVFHQPWGSPNEEASGMREERVQRIILLKQGKRATYLLQMIDSCFLLDYRCLMYPLCGPTLCDVIEDPSMPLGSRQISEIILQLVQGLRWLHQHNIIHTDLKPENIAFNTNQAVHWKEMEPGGDYTNKCMLYSTELKIIDLGSCHLPTEPRRGIVTTSLYRAPEVSAEMEWTKAIDIWALGCILYELTTGEELMYHCEDNVERLAAIERIVGPYPESFVRAARSELPGLFGQTTTPRIIFPPPSSDMGSRAVGLAVGRVESRTRLYDKVKGPRLYDILRRMLLSDPEKRASLEDIQRHSFLQDISRT